MKCAAAVILFCAELAASTTRQPLYSGESSGESRETRQLNFNSDENSYFDGSTSASKETSYEFPSYNRFPIDDYYKQRQDYPLSYQQNDDYYQANRNLNSFSIQKSVQIPFSNFKSEPLAPYPPQYNSYQSNHQTFQNYDDLFGPSYAPPSPKPTPGKTTTTTTKQTKKPTAVQSNNNILSLLLSLSQTSSNLSKPTAPKTTGKPPAPITTTQPRPKVHVYNIPNQPYNDPHQYNQNLPYQQQSHNNYYFP